MESFRCYDNFDVIATLMMTNFHLNTTVVAIFPNVCLWRHSLCSDLALTQENCIEPPSYARTAYVVAIWPSFLFDSFVKIWATWETFFGKWFTSPSPPPPPPHTFLAKRFPYAYGFSEHLTYWKSYNCMLLVFIMLTIMWTSYQTLLKHFFQLVFIPCIWFEEVLKITHAFFCSHLLYACYSINSYQTLLKQFFLFLLSSASDLRRCSKSHVRFSILIYYILAIKTLPNSTEAISFSFYPVHLSWSGAVIICTIIITVFIQRYFPLISHGRNIWS